MKINAKLLYLFFFLGIVLVCAETRPMAQSSSFLAVPHDFANCRFGVTARRDIAAYDVTLLNVGWYVDWSVNPSPPAPGGMEFVQMVRLRQDGVDGWDFGPGHSWTLLSNAISANLGAIWLVGNEPDSPFQDDMVPQAYAHAYHNIYEFIKGLDPTAKVGVGGIVQPTPLRLVYLDQVWDTYHQAYSETMPVDIWNVHSFILRETKIAPDPEPCGENTVPEWGASIPSGSLALTGELYCIRDQDDLDIFWQRLWDFRQWMANKGQRTKPLFISEYGVLGYEDWHDEDGNDFNQTRVGQLMTGTFDRMLNETAPSIGYPYDGNRLVQRWAWFSLSEDPDSWGGTLFDPIDGDPMDGQLRPLGQAYRDYTSAIGPTVDLLAAGANATPAVFWHEDAPVTATLKAVVSNIGNVPSTAPIAVAFFDGLPDEVGTNPIGTPSMIPGGLQGCADYAIAETEWSGLGLGVHKFYVQVSGGGDGSAANNVKMGSVLVANHRLLMPTILKQD